MKQQTDRDISVCWGNGNPLKLSTVTAWLMSYIMRSSASYWSHCGRHICCSFLLDIFTHTVKSFAWEPPQYTALLYVSEIHIMEDCCSSEDAQNRSCSMVSGWSTRLIIVHTAFILHRRPRSYNFMLCSMYKSEIISDKYFNVFHKWVMKSPKVFHLNFFIGTFLS